MSLEDSTRSGDEYQANHASNGEAGAAREARAAGSEAKRDFRAAWRAVRGLPSNLQSAMKTNPTAVLAGAGALGFVVGALCGSRVGRLVTTTLVGYGLRRFVEGPVAREVGRYATQVIRNAGGGPTS
jgi:hypothetical protein